jgi:hypothetical protein
VVAAGGVMNLEIRAGPPEVGERRCVGCRKALRSFAPLGAHPLGGGLVQDAADIAGQSIQREGFLQDGGG